ncbi:hypothetical protein ACFVIM_05660 [Streptomyces sp. NPDC057638]|uniref:hypothetical protein n=1 Tax=Streptomyces sp. NPDC057638 TaxID=3346190 RepID=UPI0036BB0AEE
MDDRMNRRNGYPLTVPDTLLDSDAMRRACAVRDFREIFRLVNRRTGSSQAVMAAAIGGMTSSRVSDIIRGARGIRGRGLIERVADGFGIPGEMLGLPARPWEATADGMETQDAGARGATPVGVDRRAFVTESAARSAGPMAAPHGQRAAQALDLMGGDGVSSVKDALSDLIDHYALTIRSLPPAEVYDELLAVRTQAGRLLASSVPGAQREDVTLSVGWLSCLLGIAACDMGAHAAARLWCGEADRCGREAGHPELSGWALFTRSLIAFYQGRPRESVALASRGQAITAPGTPAHAKLVTQEMRAAAMTGDADQMADARNRARVDMAKLPATATAAGVFSVSPGEDPPYTATALMLLGRHQDAVIATDHVLRTHYGPQTQRYGGHPSRGYARAQLILGLAQAGTGNLDEAVAAGHAALAGHRADWPTMTLAAKLCQVLERDFPGAHPTAEYRTRYQEVAMVPTGHHGSSGGSA